jgi:Na+/proline symporter
MNSLSILDYAVIALFFATMIGVGVFYSRRAKTSAQYFGNDKIVPWWLSGISFYMNSFSALAFVMYSALAYRYGWVPVTIGWLSVVAIIFAAWAVAVRWRRAAKNSPIDFIATRYTQKMCSFLAWLGLPMQFLDNSLKLLAIGTVVGVGLGFPLFWSICISGLIIVIYTFLGGLKAALVCDLIQFFILLLVVLTLPVACLGKLSSMDGGSGILHGFSVFIEKAPKLTESAFSFTNGIYDWMYMLIALMLLTMTTCTNWPLIQRFASTRSDADAKKMSYLVAVLFFVGPPIFFFPAMAAKVFLTEPIPPDQLNSVYAVLCRHVLPTGMIGMVIAAMFSATMSSLAGNFNAIASVITNEIYMKFDRGATAARKMIAARVATVIVGVAVIGLTFVMQYAQGAKDLFDISNKIFGVFLPPIAIPMICGILFRWLSKRSGLTALVGGIAIGLTAFAVGAWYPFLRETIPMTWITTIATIVLLVVASVLFPDREDESKQVDEFFKRLKG